MEHTKKQITAMANTLFNADIDAKMSKAAMESQFEALAREELRKLRDRVIAEGGNREAAQVLYAKGTEALLTEQGLAAEEALEALIQPDTAEEVVEEVDNAVVYASFGEEDETTADLRETLKELFERGTDRSIINRVVEDWIGAQLPAERVMSPQELDDAQFELWKSDKDAAFKLLMRQMELRKQVEKLREELTAKAEVAFETAAAPYQKKLDMFTNQIGVLEQEIERLERLLNGKSANSAPRPAAVKRVSPKAASTGGAIVIEGLSNRAFNLACLKEGIYTREEIAVMASDKGYGTEKECRVRINGLVADLKSKGKVTVDNEGNVHFV